MLFLWLIFTPIMATLILDETIVSEVSVIAKNDSSCTKTQSLLQSKIRDIVVLESICEIKRRIDFGSSRILTRSPAILFSHLVVHYVIVTGALCTENDDCRTSWLIPNRAIMTLMFSAHKVAETVNVKTCELQMS